MVKRVLVEEQLNGSMWITPQDQKLRYHEIATRSSRVCETPKAMLEKRQMRLAPNHPWCNLILCQKEKDPVVPITIILGLHPYLPFGRSYPGQPPGSGDPAARVVR